MRYQRDVLVSIWWKIKDHPFSYCKNVVMKTKKYNLIPMFGFWGRAFYRHNLEGRLQGV